MLVNLHCIPALGIYVYILNLLCYIYCILCILICMYSGGDDNVACLWRVASCSSAPWLSDDREDEDEEYDSTYNTHTHTHYLLSDDDYHVPHIQDKNQSIILNTIIHPSQGQNSDLPDVKVRHIDTHEDSVTGKYIQLLIL